MEMQRAQYCQGNSEKNNKTRGLTLFYFKTYHKATLWRIGTKANKLISRIEWGQKQIHPCPGNWFSTKLQRQFSGERIVFSTNGFGTFGYLQKNEHQCKKTKCNVNLNVKPKTIKLLDSNIGNLDDLGLDKDVLDITQKDDPQKKLINYILTKASALWKML